LAGRLFYGPVPAMLGESLLTAVQVGDQSAIGDEL